MAEWTRETPWRQGSLIASSDLMTLAADLPAGLLGGLVITHDCDLANDAQVEPWVECLPCVLIEKIDGNCEYAKNPRLLHLTLEVEGVARNIQLCAPQKFSLAKTELAGFVPVSSALSDKARQVLQGWLAARYRRHAFPDELVERMRPLSAYLQKQLKNRAHGVLGVWIDYDPRVAVTAEEPYELWLYLVYTIDSPQNHQQTEALANALHDRFSDALPGVILADCKAVSEQGFTLADQRGTVELKLEHLSHRIHPDGSFIE